MLVVLVAVACLVWSGAAGADSGNADQVGVQFLSKKQQTASLAAGADQTILKVQAINGGTAPQDIQLELIGLVDGEGAPIPDGTLAIAPPEGFAALAVGGVCTFELTFSRPVTTEASYAGEMVVYSSDGSTDRRDLELTVEGEAAATAPTEAEAGFWREIWKPAPVPVSEHLSAVTLTGTNYLPSLFSPLAPAFFWLGVALLALWRCRDALARLIPRLRPPAGRPGREGPSTGRRSRDGKRARENPRGIGLLLPGVILLVVGLALAVVAWAGWGGPWEPAWVNVKPVSVPEGTVLDSLAAEHGRIGRLERGGDALVHARSLGGAGKYTGKIDLLPADDKGDVSVTVHVADWWPYAFLTILLGVVTGFAVTSYFKHQRGKDELRVRTAKLWCEVADAEARFQTANSGRSQANYTMVPLAEKWLREVEALLEASPPDTALAKTRLDGLEAYAKAFARLQRKLEQLDKLVTEVKAGISLPVFGVAESDVEAYQFAEGLLKGRSNRTGKDYSSFADDEDGSLRVECEKDVDAALAWLSLLYSKCVPMERWLASVEEVADSDEQKKTLRESAKAALMAGSAADLELAEKAAQEAYNALTPRKRDKAKPRGPRVAALWSVPSLLGGLGKELEQAQELPEIEVQSLPSGVTPAGILGPDALFRFRVTVDLPGSGEYQLQWDYGDDTKSAPWRVPGKTGLQEVQTSHKYASGGSYVVALLANGTPAASTKVSVAKLGRWERLGEAFRLTDRQMTIVTGLLAVGSGFAAKYLTNASWGSPKDYLEAFLWGAIASEGLKVVANLAQKIWPPN